MPLYIGLLAKTRQQVNCDCDCDDMHRRVAITEVSALGVRNEKKSCYPLVINTLQKVFCSLLQNSGMPKIKILPLQR